VNTPRIVTFKSPETTGCVSFTNFEHLHSVYKGQCASKRYTSLAAWKGLKQATHFASGRLINKARGICNCHGWYLYRPCRRDLVLQGGRWPTGWSTGSCSTHTWCMVSSCRLSSGPEEVAAPSQALQSIKPQDSERLTVEQSDTIEWIYQHGDSTLLQLEQ
jgi:hypothetical protein